MRVTQAVFIISFLALNCVHVSFGTKFCKCFAWDSITLTDVDKDYDVKRVIATGISVSTKDKVFITTPRPTEDVPCTLISFNLTSTYSTSSSDCVTQRPTFTCWPSLADHSLDSCDNVINAHAGMRIDKWGRAWVMDSGRVGSDTDFKQVCPPRIHVLDLKTGEKLRMYELPATENSSPTSHPVNIVVDSTDSSENTYMYFADMVQLWVYSWASNSSWQFRHPYFSFDPVGGNFYYGFINYQQEYSGITGLALSPTKSDGYKTLYFHALASTREFSVCTSVLRNSSKTADNYFDFKEVGDRGRFGRSLGEVVSRKTGTMLFSLTDWNGTACWNPKCPYTPSSLHYLSRSAKFACDMTIDNDNVAHVLYNELPKYMAGYPPEQGKDNFFIHCGKIEELIKDTVCDPARNCC